MRKRIRFIAWSLFLGMLLMSCIKRETTVTGSEAAVIEGSQWYLTEVAGSQISPMANGKQPHIQLDPVEKSATGFSGCNNFFGSYELDGPSLKFGPVGTTRMACPDLETGLETEFLKALDQTRSWKTLDEELLFLNGSNVLARFTAAKTGEHAMDSEVEITGPVWQWMQTLYSDDRKAVPTDSESYTVQFKKGGTLSVKADCNQKGGAYSVSPEENRLSIEITHSTMAACPEDSLEDEFVQGLTAAAIYFIKDGGLYIDLKYDTGTMRFTEQKEK